MKNLEELNAKLLAKCTQYLNHQVEGRPARVGVMLDEDRTALRPMPRYTPDIAKKVYPTVSRYSTVLFETNHYSVPCKYRGKSTTVKAYPNHVEIWIEGSMVARHDRLFEHSLKAWVVRYVEKQFRDHLHQHPSQMSLSKKVR